MSSVIHARYLKSCSNYVIWSLVSGLSLIRRSIFEVVFQLCYPVSGLWSLVTLFSTHYCLSFPPFLRYDINREEKEKIENEHCCINR